MRIDFFNNFSLIVLNINIYVKQKIIESKRFDNLKVLVVKKTWLKEKLYF